MNKNKVIAIIQARRSSTRFPDKIFKIIKNKPLIYWVISRVSKSKLINPGEKSSGLKPRGAIEIAGRAQDVS